MNPFRTHRGHVAPLYRVNVDTDQIIPKQFLKRIERTGFGQFLFYDWRFSADGKRTPNLLRVSLRTISLFWISRDTRARAFWWRERILAAGRRGNMRCGRWLTSVFAP